MPVNRLRIIISCSKVKEKNNKYIILYYNNSYESGEHVVRGREIKTKRSALSIRIGQTPGMTIGLHPTFPQDDTNLIIYNLI